MNLTAGGRGRPSYVGNNGKTIKETVYAVLDQYGDKVKGAFLIEQVCARFGHNVSASVAKYKADWRRENKVNTDCRTYAGQPRRHMLNDQKWDSDQLVRLIKFNKKNDLAALLDLFRDGDGKFHSIDQLMNCVTMVTELKAA